MTAPRHPCHVLGVCQGGPRQSGCTCAPGEHSRSLPLWGRAGVGAAPFAPGVIHRYPLRRRTRVLRALCSTVMALVLLTLLALASGLLGYLLG